MFEFGTTGSILSGLATELAFGGLTALLFAVLRRQESIESFQLSQLVGLMARCTLALGPSGVGRVSVRHAGMTRALRATAGEDIDAGQEIVIVDVVGNSLKVAKAT